MIHSAVCLPQKYEDMDSLSSTHLKVLDIMVCVYYSPLGRPKHVHHGDRWLASLAEPMTSSISKRTCLKTYIG